MKDLPISLNLYKCKNLNLETIQRVLEELLSYDATFEYYVDKKPRWVRKGQDLQELLQNNYLPQSGVNKQGQDVHFSFPLKLYPLAHCPFFAVLRFYKKDEQINSFSILGLAGDFFEKTIPHLNDFASLLQKISLPLWNILEPELGWIDNDDKHPIDYIKLRKSHLHIGWVNLFSATYLEKLGQDTLWNIPCYYKKQLKNATVYLQVSESFIDAEKSKTSKSKKTDAIKKYLDDHKLTVNYFKPYQLQSDPKLYEETFANYVNLICETTFILDSTIRLKVIPIKWHDLDDVQTKTATQLIEQHTLSEMQNWKSGYKKLRIEFEKDVPQDLLKKLQKISQEEGIPVEICVA